MMKSEVKVPAIESALVSHAYRNDRVSIAVNIAATLSLAASWLSYEYLWLPYWFTLALVINGLRLITHVIYLYKNIQCTPALSLRMISCGLMLAALHLSTAAVLAFPTLIRSDQFLTLIILAAMTAGASGILAPLRRVGWIYIVIMSLPTAIVLLFPPVSEPILGGMAVIFTVVMCFGLHNNHNLLRESINLKWENSELVGQLREQYDEVQSLNSGLEERVAIRTAELNKLAYQDTLTGLPNRRGLEDWLQTSFSHYPNSVVALLFLDLDRFKQINDGFGHEIGDRVLRTIARDFAEKTPDEGVLARWGGDEFILAMRCQEGDSVDCSWREQALTVATGLLQKKHHLAEGLPSVGVSIGIAFYPLDSRSTGELIRAADFAAGEVKRLGRGQALFYEEQLSRIQKRKVDLAMALRDATHNASVCLEFQPIVHATTGQVRSLEALMRWTPDVIGSVSPAEFIPLAEESERICELGAWGLQEACRKAVYWSNDGRYPAVAVNISRRELLAEDFETILMKALRNSGLPARRLELEMQESIFAADEVHKVIAILERIKRLGVRLVLDDFGVGRSSLMCLQQLPIDGIKIDGSLVATMHNQGKIIFDAALLIARRMGLQLTAECVENVRQARELALLGVDCLQGYYLAPPRSKPSLVSWNPHWLQQPFPSH